MNNNEKKILEDVLKRSGSRSAFNPVLVSKRQARDVVPLSLRAFDYLIAKGTLETRVIGRRRFIVYKSLLAFAQRDHPGPVAGTPKNRVQPGATPEGTAASGL